MFCALLTFERMYIATCNTEDFPNTMNVDHFAAGLFQEAFQEVNDAFEESQLFVPAVDEELPLEDIVDDWSPDIRREEHTHSQGIFVSFVFSSFLTQYKIPRG